MSNGLHAIMLDVTRSDDTVVSDYISDIGFSVPLYSTAVGRAILSLMTSGERSALHTRTLETAPHLAGEKAEADRGAEDCKAHGFCFVSSWRAERSEEHTSELQSLMRISYAVFCLKKKK